MYLSVNRTMVGATCKFSGFQSAVGAEFFFPEILHFTTGGSQLKTLRLCSWLHLEGHHCMRLGGPHSCAGWFGEEENPC